MKTVNARVSILLAAILVSAFALADSGQQAQAKERADMVEERAEEAAERAEERAEKAEEQAEERAEEAEEQAESTERRAEGAEGESRSPEGATLKIKGDSGTKFSGTCTVGDEENEIEGQVPQSFDYTLDGQKFECEIQQQNAGALKVILTGDGVRAVQKINTRGGTLTLTYDGNGIISFSTSSSSSNHQVSSSSVSSSSSASSSSISSSISTR